MAKIEDISAQSFQFTQGTIPSAPASGKTKIYAKTDGKIYSQVSDGTESVLTTDTRYKGLRLARQIILTEAAATIEFNTDSDGNTLNSTLGGELLFYSGANTSITASTNCYMTLNNNAGLTAYWYRASNGISFLPIGKIGTLYTATTASVKILSGNLIISGINSYKDSTVNGVDTSPGGGMTTPQTAVTAVKLFLSSGTFPAGTVVEWWERG